MTGGGPLAVRDYSPGDVARMKADAQALRNRMFAPIPTPPLRHPAPKLVEATDFVPPGEGIQVAGDAAEELMDADGEPEFFFPDAPKVKDVRDMVSRLTGVPVIHLCGERRLSNLVKARHIAFYIAQRFTGQSYPKIGRRFGGRDHTTVLSGCRRVARIMEQAGIEHHENAQSLTTTLWDLDWTGRGK